MIKGWTLTKKISLVTMLVSSFAVLFTAAVSIWQEYSIASAQMNRQINILAKTAAYNVAAPSIFVDQKAASEILQSLQVDPNIISAKLILNNQQMLAEYQRTNSVKQPREKAAEDLLPIQTLSVDVTWKDEHVAQLSLEVDRSDLQTQ